MSEIKEMVNLMDVVESLKQQKDDVLANYAEKYKVLDRDYNVLLAKKNEVSLEVDELSKKKETLGNDINNIVAQSNDILNNANNKAKEIIESAEAEKANIISKANSVMDAANKLIEQINDREERTIKENNDATQLASDLKAKNISLDEILRSENEKNTYLDVMINNNKNKEAELKDKEEKLNALSLELAEKEKQLNAKLELASISIESNNAMKADIESKLKEAEQIKDDAKRAYDEATVVIENKKKELAKQSSNNQLRSHELDIGFAQLKEKDADLRRKEERLEAVQASLNLGNN